MHQVGGRRGDAQDHNRRAAPPRPAEVRHRSHRMRTSIPTGLGRLVESGCRPGHWRDRKPAIPPPRSASYAIPVPSLFGPDGGRAGCSRNSLRGCVHYPPPSCPQGPPYPHSQGQGRLRRGTEDGPNSESLPALRVAPCLSARPVLRSPESPRFHASQPKPGITCLRPKDSFQRAPGRCWRAFEAIASQTSGTCFREAGDRGGACHLPGTGCPRESCPARTGCGGPQEWRGQLVHSSKLPGRGRSFSPRSATRRTPA